MVGIVGYGHVGSAMGQLFQDAVIYDKYLERGTQEEINACDIVFVCVPTPMAEDGSCDTSCVDEVLEWIEAKVIVIRSTVPVGYTRSKRQQLGKHIVFQPEYYGETLHHPLADLSKRNWIVLGGNEEDTGMVAKVYQKVYTSELRIVKTDSDTAELAKYMGNTFLAVKVIFCNEFFDIAKALGVDYDQLREIWLMDPRISRTHTFVYEEDRGYGGSCFPKDMSALKFIADAKGVSSEMINAAIRKNQEYRNQ